MRSMREIARCFEAYFTRGLNLVLNALALSVRLIMPHE